MVGWYWLFVVMPILAVLVLVWSALHADRTQRRSKRQEPGSTKTSAVVRVGKGRGFVVEGKRGRIVLTAGHCLPKFPICAPLGHRTGRGAAPAVFRYGAVTSKGLGSGWQSPVPC